MLAAIISSALALSSPSTERNPEHVGFPCRSPRILLDEPWQVVADDSSWMTPGTVESKFLKGCPYIEILNLPFRGAGVLEPREADVEAVASAVRELFRDYHVEVVVEGVEDVTRYEGENCDASDADSEYECLKRRQERARRRAELFISSLERNLTLLDIPIRQGRSHIKEREGHRGVVVFLVWWLRSTQQRSPTPPPPDPPSASTVEDQLARIEKRLETLAPPATAPREPLLVGPSMSFGPVLGDNTHAVRFGSAASLGLHISPAWSRIAAEFNTSFSILESRGVVSTPRGDIDVMGRAFMGVVDAAVLRGRFSAGVRVSFGGVRQNATPLVSGPDRGVGLLAAGPVVGLRTRRQQGPGGGLYYALQQLVLPFDPAVDVVPGRVHMVELRVWWESCAHGEKCRPRTR